MLQRLKKLNGWQRIGVVLSVLWALYGFYLGNEIGLHQGDGAEAVLHLCTDAPHSDFNACYAQFDKEWSEAIKYHWDYAAFLSLVPIPLAWLAIYGLLALVRWIRAGFASPSSETHQIKEG
jgi:hypothetical protein